METKRICFALDLKDEPEIILEYDRWHQAGNAWPEITCSIREADILDMQIYRTGNRLFMIMEVGDTFDPEQKARLDAKNPKVIEWERLMSAFQEPLPWAKPGQKWVPMEQIFQL